jgi:hypothetical protein
LIFVSLIKKTHNERITSLRVLLEEVVLLVVRLFLWARELPCVV